MYREDPCFLSIIVAQLRNGSHSVGTPIEPLTKLKSPDEHRLDLLKPRLSSTEATFPRRSLLPVVWNESLANK